ncbi:MAG: CpXC domain-containing protein [Solobacterium sp.]|jgi:hypothetical protein|nr:CpXC domain-containing protein [Solobacterium sp.]
MSASHDLQYKCPYCGQEFTITVYDTVTASKDPDLRDRVLSGDIFQHTCDHCHKEFMIQNPLLYSDKEHKFVLFLSQNDVGTSLAEFAKPLVSQGYRLRRCATIQELVEKIEIFEEGMNDIAVELAKYDSFIEFLENKKGKAEDVTSVAYEHAKDDVMKIVVHTGDRGMSFLIPVNMIEEELKTEEDLYTVNDEDFPLINQDWIISLFKQSDGKA